MYARFNSMTEHALTEYRDQLAAFDQTIQEYQDMLDGKAALPEDMTIEQVQTMLNLVKETRAQFLQDAVKKSTAACPSQIALRMTDCSTHSIRRFGRILRERRKGSRFLVY